MRPRKVQPRPRGSNKPIQERVRAQLAALEQSRRDGCYHQAHRRDPADARRWICIDCGAVR